MPERRKDRADLCGQTSGSSPALCFRLRLWQRSPTNFRSGAAAPRTTISFRMPAMMTSITTSMLITVFDTLGSLAFAVSGALTGLKHRLDLFGVAVLAIVTTTGGGIMRDVMLGYIPPHSLRTPRIVLLCCAMAGIVFLFGHTFQRLNLLVLIFDAIGLGAFVSTGASLAYTLPDSNLYLVTVMGTITAVGGSMTRDILVREIPVVLRKTELYACVCIAGAFAYYAAMRWTGNTVLAVNLCCFGTIGLRFFVMYTHVTLPAKELAETEKKTNQSNTDPRE